MAEIAKAALGVRKPGRETIEFVVVETRDGHGLLDVLRRDHGDNPLGAFPQLAGRKRLIEGADSIRFHDWARRAGANRWFLHQGGRWHGGAVKRAGGLSLVSRWHNVAAAFGGDRFLPGRFSLSEERAGLRRHCILGVLVELFLDDYPTALDRLVSPEGLPDAYIERGGNEIYMHSLPPIVRKTAGLVSGLGAFHLNLSVELALERNYGATATQIGRELDRWDLMALNDHALNWPASAELIALPAPGLFQWTP